MLPVVEHAQGSHEDEKPGGIARLKSCENQVFNMETPHSDARADQPPARRELTDLEKLQMQLEFERQRADRAEKALNDAVKNLRRKSLDHANSPTRRTGVNYSLDLQAELTANHAAAESRTSSTVFSRLESATRTASSNSAPPSVLNTWMEKNDGQNDGESKTVGQPALGEELEKEDEVGQGSHKESINGEGNGEVNEGNGEGNGDGNGESMLGKRNRGARRWMQP